MITPRKTRLVRVRDLHVMRRVVARLVAVNEAARQGRQAVIVPTGGAARQLRRTVERLEGIALTSGTEFVTREQWYETLAAGLNDSPRRLSPFERDMLAQAAATAAAAEAQGLTFQLRPGLIAEILNFYDDMRRQGQQVQRFEELITEAVDPSIATGDRGASRMLLQTRFLAGTFREYESRVADFGACDEHGLRALLLAAPAASPIRRTVVAVGDWIADPGGLFPADFDFLTRVDGLEQIEVVATDASLASGFHQRLRDWLPGLDEVDGSAIAEAAPLRPTLVVPPSESDKQWHTCRDRAEELTACARRIKADRRGGRVVPLDRIGIVYRKPLPYLYLARETIGAAGIRWRSADALPLAGEPTAAALDLVLEFVETGFTRDTAVALLRSPHFRFDETEQPVTRHAVAALDRALSQLRYLGELSRLESLAADWKIPAAGPALQAALEAARRLSALTEPSAASVQLDRLRAFLLERFRPLAADDPLAAREARARTAIVDLLERLSRAHAAHHDPAWTIEDLSAGVRRWIGTQTFEPSDQGEGIELLDDQAARYGLFDDLFIVGLIERDWPEATRRNIFYAPTLLKALGWPPERDRRAADDSRFLDLVASASGRVAVSTLTLDDENLVTRSAQLDELPRLRLSTLPDAPAANARIVPEDVLTAPDPSLAALEPPVREWAALRMARPPADAPAFHGSVGRLEPRAWSVSALETYLGCPFRFFAQHVLRLEEEPEDEEVMDPRRQGLFVHDVFEAFFDEWQQAGHRSVTAENLDAAGAMFASVVDRKLGGIPAAEAGLERTRLLGSSAAAGLGDAVFRMEAERPTRVVERLLEHRLEGAFEIATPEGVRTIRLRGKIDRLDLLEDGTFRLIDYKLGWPPNRSRALQLPIYGICAEQRLTGHGGRSWTLGEAVYLAFKGPKRVVPLFTHADREKVLADAQARLVQVVDAIERGEFPPTPDDIYRCDTCTFTAVCRKDYVGDTA